MSGAINKKGLVLVEEIQSDLDNLLTNIKLNYETNNCMYIFEC